MLRPILIHFRESLAQLGGRQSISARPMPGGPVQAQRLERQVGGYLIGWGGKLFFVHNEAIACVEVEEYGLTPAGEPVPVKPPEPVISPREKALAELRAQLHALENPHLALSLPTPVVIPQSPTIYYTPEEQAARRAKQALIDEANARQDGPKCPHGVPVSGICPACVQANRLAAGIVPGLPQLDEAERERANEIIRMAHEAGITPQDMEARIIKQEKIAGALKRKAEREAKRKEEEARLAAMTPAEKEARAAAELEVMRAVAAQGQLEAE